MRPSALPEGSSPVKTHKWSAGKIGRSELALVEAYPARGPCCVVFELEALLKRTAMMMLTYKPN